MSLDPTQRERETPGTGALSEPIGIKGTVKEYEGLNRERNKLHSL
jgi:hypothetical protein